VTLVDPLPSFDAWEVELHGHQVVYRVAGSGPPVVLVHGMVNSSRHWQAVATRLAVNHTVIAPDLIGHGDSATPRGDYSLGAHAAVIRDLLTVLGVERATMVGHSLGGGIAMAYFWQFPERVERIALVSSGGLGPEVSSLLRTASLPGAQHLLALVANRRVIGAMEGLGTALRKRHIALGVKLQGLARALRPLETKGGREAFAQTLRAVIDLGGQRVSANDRLYLAAGVPTLIAWGDRDHTIPIEHGRAAHEEIPGSRFVTIPGAAHFPHLEQPEALAAALDDFIAATEPAELDETAWRDRLLRSASAEPRPRAIAR
jgi:pimeloyl-ACP methyl ester carboxylesterase